MLVDIVEIPFWKFVNESNSPYVVDKVESSTLFTKVLNMILSCVNKVLTFDCVSVESLICI